MLVQYGSIIDLLIGILLQISPLKQLSYFRKIFDSAGTAAAIAPKLGRAVVGCAYNGCGASTNLTATISKIRSCHQTEAVDKVGAERHWTVAREASFEGRTRGSSGR